jgi:hypothetical protein
LLISEIVTASTNNEIFLLGISEETIFVYVCDLGGTTGAAIGDTIDAGTKVTGLGVGSSPHPVSDRQVIGNKNDILGSLKLPMKE